MKIDDSTILTLNPMALLSSDFLYSLIEIDEPEEKARLQAVAEIRAQQLKIERQFKNVIKAYNQANDKLAKEYTKQNSNAEIQLEYDGNGKPIASIDNFLQIMTKDSHFKGLKFNLLTYSPEQERDGDMFKWSDADDAETRHYIEKKYKIHNQQKCDDALRIMFNSNPYHPIRDLIDGLVWDGEERIQKFLHKWTKCEDTAYTREVSRLIFAGGINRLYDPGCKFDDMPVLIGTKQGEGKSTLVRWIAMEDDYYTEVTDFDGQSGIEGLEGAWICEVGELLALTKTKEQEAVKSFLTRQNDKYRMPYDKRTTDHLRQCIFIGTTNKEQFLTDKTGNRRFYPIKVNQTGYDLFEHKDEVKTYIRQCWAEAHTKYMSGEMLPYASKELRNIIRQKQSDAVEDDYREGMIRDYLEDKAEVCILEIWQQALKMGEFSKPTKKDSNEISLILQNFDEWEKQDKPKRLPNYGVQKVWVKDLNEDIPF